MKKGKAVVANKLAVMPEETQKTNTIKPYVPMWFEKGSMLNFIPLEIRLETENQLLHYVFRK